MKHSFAMAIEDSLKCRSPLRWHIDECSCSGQRSLQVYLAYLDTVVLWLCRLILRYCPAISLDSHRLPSGATRTCLPEGIGFA
jgi:hypothetical protein